MAWATVDELTAFVADDTEIPGDAGRLLERASELVGYVTRFAVYDVNTDDEPTDTTVLAALRAATCAQVEYWLISGEDDDIGVEPTTISVGPLSVGWGASRTGVGSGFTAPILAPRAQRILGNADLLSTVINVPAGVWW